MIKLLKTTPPLADEKYLTERKIDKLLHKATSKLITFGRSLVNAEEFVEEALRLCKEIDDYDRQATAYMVLGRIKFAQGKFVDAFDLHRQARRIWEYECTNQNRNIKCFEKNLVYMLKTMVAKDVLPEHRNKVADECNCASQLIVNFRGALINTGSFGNSIDTVLQNIALFFLY